MARPAGRWRALALVVLAGASVTLFAGTSSSGGSPVPSPPPAPTTVVALNGQQAGPAFQGVGAISGGGGNSRYLIDYPAPQQTAILDYLFKPDYGASLQLLKLEIGGGANSSDGSEPSIEPVRGRIDCNVGYEFWLARQAERRNPEIALYGLQWSAPGWVRAKDGLWGDADIEYLLDWLGCARNAGLHISYLGGWNEHYEAGSSAIASWYVALRRALDQHGYSQVKIVAADAFGNPSAKAWAVANDLSADPAFRRAVAVIGAHDVCGAESHGSVCSVTAAARRLFAQDGKLLWQSEFGRTPAAGSPPLEEGPGGLARVLVNGYLDAGITATLLWPAVDAMPPGLPFSNRGLATADQPWSGHYQVNLLTWVVAQTTQFTAPGWRFVAGGGGRLAGGGSYVTYESPSRDAWSTVVQTSTAATSQVLRLRLAGGLPFKVHVWMTALDGSRSLVDLGTLRPKAGWYSYRLSAAAVYTFTSSTGQSKAAASAPWIPPSRPLPQRYTAHADAAGMPDLMAPMEGSFAYIKGVLTQTTVARPVGWIGCDLALPFAIVGGASWSDYRVRASVELPKPSAAGAPPGALLIAGFNGVDEPCGFSGYELTVDAAGLWQVLRSREPPLVLASGRVSPASRYTMSLSVQARRLTASIDGKAVSSLVLPSAVHGPAGLGTLTFDAVRFIGFSVS